MKRFIIVALNWILVTIAVVAGVVGAPAAFLGLAFVVSSTAVLCVAAATACCLISHGLARAPAKRITRHHGRRLALIVGLGTTALVVLTSLFTVFKPVSRAPDPRSNVPPSDVRFWQLSTGSRIAYTRIASPSRTHDEPVIFVHGGPGARIAADETVTEIFLPLSRDGYDIYLYDQIGGGYSGRLKNIRDYTVDRHLADLEAIRVQLGGDKAILIGESWGARLIVEYATVYPENLKKCILVSPAPLRLDEWKDESPGSAVDRLSEDKRRAANKLINPRLVAAMLLMRINPQAAYNFIPEAEIDALAADLFSLLLEGTVCDPANRLEQSDNLLSVWAGKMTWMDLKKRERGVFASHASLASTEIPFLIFRGECDYAKWDVTYQYKRVIPNSVLLFVEDAGHMILLERPDLFVDAVRAYLSNEPLPLQPYTKSTPPEAQRRTNPK